MMMNHFGINRHCCGYSKQAAYLLFIDENIALVGFTAQFEACLARDNVVITQKLCSHRLRFLGVDDR